MLALNFEELQPKGRRFFDTSMGSLRLQVRIASLDLAVNGEDCALARVHPRGQYGRAKPQPAMTADEFLAWETAQHERHEFVDGEVFAMAGAEDRHVTVCLNVALALRQRLSGSPCRTFIPDMKVAAADDASFFYPDIFVTCSQTDRKSPLVKREPTLIVEVLSRSTAAYDLGDKFAHYRRIASLREIAFVDLDARRTAVYRPGTDALWVLHSFDRDTPVHLASVDLTITAAALFADVDEA